MRKIIALSLLAVSHSGFAAVYKDSFTDVNFGLCEGVGITASGRINIRVEYEKHGGNFVVSDVLLVSNYATANAVTGKLTFLNESNTKTVIILQKPWYPTIGNLGSTSLTNPQIRTTVSPGVDDKQVFTIGNTGVITIDSNTTHKSGSNSCPASFKQDIKLQ